MKILLTGSTGFLGKKLVEKLTKKRLDINFIDRSYCDITDKSSLLRMKKKLGKIDSIVHLAALVPRQANNATAFEMFKVNTLGTINILEVFGKKINGFTYISTAEVYGPAVRNKSIKENGPTKPISFYAASKLAAEIYCQVFAKKHNLPISILRPTTLYGPGDLIDRAIPNFIKSALSEKSLKVYGGKQKRDYLHIEDATDAIYLAIINNQSDVFNIGSGKGITISKVAKTIQKTINSKLKIRFLKVKGKPKDIVLNIGKAKKLLKFNPKFHFPDKLEEEIEWLRKNQ